jgi:hypothetical protein
MNKLILLQPFTTSINQCRLSFLQQLQHLRRIVLAIEQQQHSSLQETSNGEILQIHKSIINPMNSMQLLPHKEEEEEEQQTTKYKSKQEKESILFNIKTTNIENMKITMANLQDFIDQNNKQYQIIYDEIQENIISKCILIADGILHATIHELETYITIVSLLDVDDYVV